jgi:hypothetical protein
MGWALREDDDGTYKLERTRYMEAMGTLLEDDDGTHKLERTAAPNAQHSMRPMNGLGLLLRCLREGLPVADPEPLVALLSGGQGGVLCINTTKGVAKRGKRSRAEPFSRARTTRTAPTTTRTAPTTTTRTAPTTTAIDNPLLQMAKTAPTLAMAQLFQIPERHPWLADGVRVVSVDSAAGLETAARRINQGHPGPMATPAHTPEPPMGDGEFEAMFDGILAGMSTGARPGAAPGDAAPFFGNMPMGQDMTAGMYPHTTHTVSHI